jgi:hypothetical protein
MPEFFCSSHVLSAEQEQRISACRRQVRDAIRDRDDYITRHNLDPSIWNPAANWDRSQWFYRDAHQLIDGDEAQDLRRLSRQFTGRAMPVANDQPDVLAIVQFRHYKKHLPDYLHISPPALFHESGWLIDGMIVNYDAMAYWERIAALYQAGLLDRDSPHGLKPGARILEIGGGYGGLAYFLRRAIGAMNYTIVDLPESLIYSSMYLSASFETGFRFLPNYRFHEISGEQFDLVINTLSMAEMSEPQVRAYCAALPRMAPMFFEQNHDCRFIGWLNPEEIIADYFPHRAPIHNRAGAPGLIQGVAHVWSSNPLPEAMSRVVPGLLIPAFSTELVPIGAYRVFDFLGMICAVPQSAEIGPRDNISQLPGSRCFETLADAHAQLGVGAQSI